jgi:hypothetical protein
MTLSPRHAPGLEVERDASERLSADDMATIREAEFLADALTHQRLSADRMAGRSPGVCSNCGEPCLPTAAYCDADCRADHEHRLTVAARTGRTLG